MVAEVPGGVEPSPDQEPAAGDAPLSPRFIVALVVAQLGCHSSMAGFRMAAPLQTLTEGASTGEVGLLLALFAAAPVVLALSAGRMADRHGFHRPMHLAVAMTVAGALLALLSTRLPGGWHVLALSLGAILSGGGANFGVLAIQRTGGLAARDAIDRVRLFSWLGVAPSLANVVGPVTAGFVIDSAGFAAAYAWMAVLPLGTLWAMRAVPRRTTGAQPAAHVQPHGSPLTLLKAPGLARLLFINWLLAICWDVHSFAVPVLGHSYGFSASTIGLILGTFTLSVSLIRLAIPWLAHRLQERRVVALCMVGTMLIYALYPLARTPTRMAFLAALLGITLGAAQPMIMSTLHRLTPDNRHGESLAFRSMAINFSSALMPLAFGALGIVMGAGSLFWLVGAAVGSGAWVTRRLPQVR